jgi:transposase
MPDARFHDHSGPPTCRRGHKKGDDGQALGRSRGGFSTKLHLAVDACGGPVEMILTPGQEHDVLQAPTLLAEHEPRYVIADKGYDSDDFVELITQRGSRAVIPARSNRTTPRRLSRKQYRRRNVVERFVNRIKHYRRIATRYEKTAVNFLGFLQFAALLVWLH